MSLFSAPPVGRKVMQLTWPNQGTRTTVIRGAELGSEWSGRALLEEKAG